MTKPGQGNMTSPVTAPVTSPETAAPSVATSPMMTGGGLLPQPGQPPAMTSEIAQALVGQPFFAGKKTMGV